MTRSGTSGRPQGIPKRFDQVEDELSSSANSHPQTSLACGKKRGAHRPTSQAGGNWICPKEGPVDGGLNPARTSRVGQSG